MKETTPRLIDVEWAAFRPRSPASVRLRIGDRWRSRVEPDSCMAKFGPVRAHRSPFRRLPGRTDAGAVRSDGLPCAVMGVA